MTQKTLSAFLTKNTKSTPPKKSNMYIAAFFKMAQIGNSLVCMYVYVYVSMCVYVYIYIYIYLCQ